MWVNVRPTILQRVAGDPWPVSQQFRPEEERVPKARMLLDAGARLDSRDEWSKSTPLGVACREGRIELVKLFLEHGADPVEADAGPWATPLAWAEKMKHADVPHCCGITSLEPHRSRKQVVENPAQ